MTEPTPGRARLLAIWAEIQTEAKGQPKTETRPKAGVNSDAAPHRP